MQLDIRKIGLMLACGVAVNVGVSAQTFSDAQKGEVQKVVSSYLPQSMQIGNLKVLDMSQSGDTLVVNLSENFGDIPFTKVSVDKMKEEIKQAVGSSFTGKNVKVNIAGNDIDLYYSSFEPSYSRKHKPFVTDLNPNRHYSKGLDGNVIAMWQSHGWYFEPKLNRWEWQRARIFQTVEDLYTQSYVMPFLNPMLENAGAYVWSPRERDTNENEVIVDNDGGNAQKGYAEVSKGEKWGKGSDKGFAYLKNEYKDFENPFADGTYRQVKTTKDKRNQSTATWSANIPETGEYAIYVSYKTLPNSASDALYTINTLDGERQVMIDQTMAGGVWVYLGHFKLAKGDNKDVVTLTNLSNEKDKVVTADAMKIGGGQGNIARIVAPRTDANLALAKEQGNEKCLAKPGVDYKYITSKHPRYTEGARYFLQWSGFPDSVYSTSHGINDYTDDYKCRGEWVNYLAGGSEVLPNRKGLNVPVDLSFAFHSDAGTTQNDDVIGSLGIYCTKENGKSFGKYANGTPREISRQLTNMVLTEICKDVRAKFEPNWTRRGMWDRSYYEARVPEVPGMLLELLSHQNFADMKYGLDPNFRFTVSRAVYKGILKFIAKRDHRDYVVQPLPVNSFAIRPASDGRFLLTWKPTADSLSENADAKKYVICERVGQDGGFKEIAVVKGTEFLVKIKENEVHSYKIIAVNDGGRSFPSEVLSVGVAPNSKGTVMVVNGFTRVSGPDWYDSGERAGFDDAKDHGVPYMQQINYIGSQFEFRRGLPWRDDDAGGFGDSRSTYETQPVAGNTFDYPAVHGESILKSGYSFVSTSVKAVDEGTVYLNDYKLVDLILGKQKETINGRGAYPSRYSAYTPGLIDAITNYTKAGGNILVSGAYVASDIWDRDTVSYPETHFAEQVLGYTYLKGQAAVTGKVFCVPSQFASLSGDGELSFVQKLNTKVYAVESPDAIKASDDSGATIMRYRENNIPAAVASQRAGYRTVVMGFPIEVIDNASQRDDVMGNVLKFLEGK